MEHHHVTMWSKQDIIFGCWPVIIYIYSYSFIFGMISWWKVKMEATMSPLKRSHKSAKH